MAARSHRRRSWALASVAVSLALLAPACGSDDNASSAALDAAAATTTAATDAPAGETPATASADDGAADTAPPATETPATEAPAEAPAAAPIELLSFSATLVGGGTFDGAGYAAERPVAFWFWAPT